jgi:hypothetical protein
MGVNFICYAVAHQRLDHWDPTVFSIALAAGIVSLVVVSLLTPPEPGAALDVFYGNLDTPSGIGEEGVKPIEAARAGRQLLLVNLLHLRQGACGVGFFRAYRTDLKGLLVGAVFVAALVAALSLFVRFG